MRWISLECIVWPSILSDRRMSSFVTIFRPLSLFASSSCWWCSVGYWPVVYLGIQSELSESMILSCNYVCKDEFVFRSRTPTQRFGTLVLPRISQKLSSHPLPRYLCVRNAFPHSVLRVSFHVNILSEFILWVLVQRFVSFYCSFDKGCFLCDKINCFNFRSHTCWSTHMNEFEFLSGFYFINTSIY